MNFASARNKAGFTQQEVADRLGICRNSVHLWETGKAFPRAPMLKMVAGLYGITVDELLQQKQGIEQVTGSMDRNSKSEISSKIEESAKRVGDAANKMVSMSSMLNLTLAEFRRAFEIAIEYIPHEQHQVK